MWNKSKNVLQNETKDLTFAFSNLSITFFFLKLFRMRGQKFITFTQKGGEVLKFVAFLRILLFLNNWSIVYFCEWGWVLRGVKTLVIFVDVIIVWSEVLTKQRFLALVSVLKWNSQPHFLVYVHSKWRVT